MPYSFFYVYGIMKENWSNLIKLSIIKYSFGCNAIKLKICNFGTNMLLITLSIKRKNTYQISRKTSIRLYNIQIKKIPISCAIYGLQNIFWHFYNIVYRHSNISDKMP